MVIGSEIIDERPFCDAAFFLRRGFRANEDGSFEKRMRIISGMSAHHADVHFTVYEVRAGLGVNVEQRIDGELVMSAYVHNDKDFTQTFNL